LVSSFDDCADDCYHVHLKKHSSLTCFPRMVSDIRVCAVQQSVVYVLLQPRKWSLAGEVKWHLVLQIV